MHPKYGLSSGPFMNCIQVRRLSIRIVALAAVFASIELLHADPLVEKTTWRDLPAYRITDGKTEAIAVPQLGGRVVRYGRVGGFNFLWNGEQGTERNGDALMWGGDKTYVGPHTMWRFTQPQMWPPPAPDRTSWEASASGDNHLRMTSAPWPGYGTRITRELAFDADGSLVFTHTVDPAPGSTLLGAVWTVTQTIPSDAVFAPLNPKSPYKSGVFWFDAISMEKAGASLLNPGLLQIKTIVGTGFKLGADARKPALASVKDGLAFVLTADPEKGQYPEGADGAGMSIEIYHHDLPPPREYVELEFLSPLRKLDEGATLRTHWRIEETSHTAGAIEKLLVK